MKPGNKPLRLRIRAVYAAFAALGLLFASQSHASTLADALQQAWTLHPHAAALDARVAEARARAELAASLTPGPAVVSFGHLNQRPGSDRGKQEWEVELAAPLWLPRQKDAQTAAAATELQAIENQTAALRLELAGELRNAGWALNAARASNALAQHRLSSAQSLEADVMRRYRTGEVSRIDANLARGETLAAQAENLAAKSALQQAESTWRGLTGMASPVRMETETLAEMHQDGGDPNENFIHQALTRHPRVAELASAARVARARLNMVRESRRDAPELALRMLRERGDRSEAYGHAIGVKLSIPFSSGPRLRRDDATARAELSQAEADLLRITQRLKLVARQASLELVAAEQQLMLAQTGETLANDSLALAEKAFRLGESGLAALLRARADAQAAATRLKQRENARGQAVSQLKQAIGHMP